ncbi:putative ubiquitin carboxyl-terminal hydrolase creB [Cytospora mali]|uniref:Ubiquitin carboxyl-terminal hydrolase creB n=1 Tax=Cytospora mali TaxID=578113 RepID=A0A194VPG3_CYTMA|nr:putative ubiquitin carboxyl-terminal hydrolase creB [Valsa mali]
MYPSNPRTPTQRGWPYPMNFSQGNTLLFFLPMPLILNRSLSACLSGLSACVDDRASLPWPFKSPASDSLLSSLILSSLSFSLSLFLSFSPPPSHPIDLRLRDLLPRFARFKKPGLELATGLDTDTSFDTLLFFLSSSAASALLSANAFCNSSSLFLRASVIRLAFSLRRLSSSFAASFSASFRAFSAALCSFFSIFLSSLLCIGVWNSSSGIAGVAGVLSSPAGAGGDTAFKECVMIGSGILS